MLLQTEHISPRPEEIPRPDVRKSCKAVKLADLPSGQYVTVVARVTSVRVREVVDRLGSKQVLSGSLEDDTFRAPYVCHRTALPLERGSIIEISSAYVHEFEDRALLLVLTEHTDVKLQNSEDGSRYVWFPRIGGIRRPVWNVVLSGVVSRLFNSSGLVKRCNNCKAIIHGPCPNCRDAGWDWDLRASCLLQDKTGSMRMILGRHLSSKVLERNLGEVLLLAKAKRIPSEDNVGPATFNLSMPKEFRIMEALVEDPSRYRHHGSLVISDGVMRIYFPKGEGIAGELVNATERALDPRADQGSKLIRRLVERALERSIEEITGGPRTHGIYLLEDPISLFCEKAKLYAGFSTNIRVEGERLIVEAWPQACVRESVWDYIHWRRERGATADAIERSLVTWRSNIVAAPFGHSGRIEGLIFKSAGEARVSELDGRDFTRFWHETYDIDVSPDEMPLVRVKLLDLDLSLTYPPSCIYFDEGVLRPRGGISGFVEGKRASAGIRVKEVMRRALQDIKIGDIALRQIDGDEGWMDVQGLIMHEIRERLIGTDVRARGSVSLVGGQPYFFPSEIVRRS